MVLWKRDRNDCRTRVFRLQQDFLGGAPLDHLAGIHHDDLVGDVAGEGHLVGDDDHRHAFGGELSS